MYTQKKETRSNMETSSRFSRYCMRAAAGALTLAMIGGCVPALNPGAAYGNGWSIEVSAAETGDTAAEGWLNEDGTLKDGRYKVPLSMMNASKPESASMAASCIVGDTQELEVKNGVMTMTVNLQAVTVFGVTAWANNWKIYQENNMTGDPVPAENFTDNDGHVNQIQFTLPTGAYDAGGVFVSMTVPDMGNAEMQAWFAIDFSGAECISPALEDGIYAVQGNIYKAEPNLGTSLSMADKAIAHTMKVEVKQGKYTLTMNFNGIDMYSMFGYLGSLQYYGESYTVNNNNYPTGTLNEVKVLTYQEYTDGERVKDGYGTDYPDRIQFDLIPEALVDGYVPIQVNIPIMDSVQQGLGDQDAWLYLDWSTAESTDADDERFAEGDVELDNPSAPVEDPDDGKDDQGSGDQDNKPSGDTQKPGSGTGQNQNNQNSQNTATKPGAGAQAAALTTGNTYTVGGNTYQATSAGTVTVKAVANKKSVNIPASVTVGGVKANVTAIGNNAFKKAKKKLTKVTIGANVTSIGKKAFAGCKKLKKITIKSKKLASVGTKAFKGISKKAVIKVPKAKQKAYVKLLKNKGQAKSVKIR